MVMRVTFPNVISKLFVTFTTYYSITEICIVELSCHIRLKVGTLLEWVLANLFTASEIISRIIHLNYP